MRKETRRRAGRTEDPAELPKCRAIDRRDFWDQQPARVEDGARKARGVLTSAGRFAVGFPNPGLHPPSIRFPRR